MNIAIIVAAGSGKRFGGNIPKQFTDIHGKPLLIHTLEKFENCPAIDEIALVLSADGIPYFKHISDDHSFDKLKNLVKGGESRAESVFAGISSLNCAAEDIIAVHDGARPLVTSAEISETVEKAKETGAACLVGKMNDTVKRTSHGQIVDTLNRADLRRAFTPQCFRFEILNRAFQKSALSESVTDECSLVENLGIEISFVDGSSNNIKITTPEDVKIAELFLQ